MASKAREALEKVESGESHVCSSGVRIWVRPIPALLLRRLEAKIAIDYPEPIVPKKTVEVLGGTEEVEDLNNAEYQEAKSAINIKRIELQGEAILDFCVDLDGGIEAYASTIARIEKQLGETYPTDLEERRILFLTEYAIRNGSDWGFVFASAIEQTQVTDPEVSKRMDSFRDKVAQPKTNGTTPSSPNEIERVDLQPAV